MLSHSASASTLLLVLVPEFLPWWFNQFSSAKSREKKPYITLNDWLQNIIERQRSDQSAHLSGGRQRRQGAWSCLVIREHRYIDSWNVLSHTLSSIKSVWIWRCQNNMLVFFLVYRIDVIQKGFFPARIANTPSCEYLYALCSANCCQGWFYRFSHFLIQSWGPEGRRLPWWWWCSAVWGQDSHTTLNITTWCLGLSRYDVIIFWGVLPPNGGQIILHNLMILHST